MGRVHGLEVCGEITTPSKGLSCAARMTNHMTRTTWLLYESYHRQYRHWETF